MEIISYVRRRRTVPSPKIIGCWFTRRFRIEFFGISFVPKRWSFLFSFSLSVSIWVSLCHVIASFFHSFSSGCFIFSYSIVRKWNVFELIGYYFFLLVFASRKWWEGPILIFLWFGIDTNLSAGLSKSMIFLSKMTRLQLRFTSHVFLWQPLTFGLAYRSMNMRETAFCYNLSPLLCLLLF